MTWIKVKYKIDFFIALICFIMTTPLFLIIAILIKIDSNGPVLLKQVRVGQNQQLFTIYKFRTMKIDAPSNVPTHLFSNQNNHITKLGWILRLSSLDELPQLINILKGEMSLIGPRPALECQYDIIESRNYSGANQLRPGLTGLAQILGRNEISNQLKGYYDGVYYKQLSLKLDLKILIVTPVQVVKLVNSQCCLKVFSSEFNVFKNEKGGVLYESNITL